MHNLNENSALDNGSVLVFGSPDILSLLDGQEKQVIEAIRTAYKNHGIGDSSLPHSTFLRFPDEPANRIIALPAYLGGEVNAAGMKWIASFPGNLELGLDRASAILILNSASTGRPKAIMEASIISARRTAASAALAAQILDKGASRTAGLIGCGQINFEIARFLLAACPNISRFLIYDLEESRARAFKLQFEQKLGLVEVKTTNNIKDVIGQTSLISFATTAGTPHIDQMNCSPETVILHISLRDLAPEIILAGDNVVDDIDHVCRAQTSIHLAEQASGNRKFIRCTLADILHGKAEARRPGSSPIIFSPFGLGVLDIALGEYVLQQAMLQGKGFLVPSFLPASWRRTSEAMSAQSS